MNKQRELKELILSNETLLVPDAFDPISARIIEYSRFKSVQCSGYSISLAQAYSDERNLTLEENLRRTEEIVNAVNIPVMADGEDGYGRGEEFRENILKFIKTGVAGINIEDQNLWNNAGNDRVVPIGHALDKIQTVQKLKKEKGIPDFIINARTDALQSSDSRKEGMKEAIKRANLFLEAGADICFIPYIATLDEIKLLNTEINGPVSIAAGLPYNINNFTINDCREIGIARVSLPATMIFSSIQSMISSLSSIADTGEFKESDSHINMQAISDLINGNKKR